jgi:hypothetical protein
MATKTLVGKRPATESTDSEYLKVNAFIALKQFVENSSEITWNPCLACIDTEPQKKVKIQFLRNSKPNKFVLEILDHRIELNGALSNLHEEIISSKIYLSYKEDWDDENALGCDPDVYLNTIKLLVTYANYIYNISTIEIKVPEINFARDGSFDLEWRCEKRMLLMNILNKKDLDVHFYGEDTKSNTTLKGFLDGFEINNHLSFWLQKL